MWKLLIAFTLSACIPFFWQPLWGQAPREGKESSHNQKKQSELRAGESDQRGTHASPVIVDVLSRPKTPAEAAEDKRKNDEKEVQDRWTFRSAVAVAALTGLLAIIGYRGVRAANKTLKEIERQANLMETQINDARKSSEASAKDVQASIAEAVRSARAMEGVAESMAVNAASVKESVRISREIADMQKLATTLQSRAYISAFFHTAVFQDANNIFEVKAVLKNHGNTPAYDVTFSAVSQIVSMPIPEDFAFQLPDTAAGNSVSLMAPGTTKIINRCVSGGVPEDQVEAIKRIGTAQSLAMWGVVNYRDAFNETRYVKFAFTVKWIPWLPGHDKDKDGNPLPPQIMSYDTARHNDAN